MQYKEYHKNTKEAYTHGSNSMIKNVDFAAVFTYITRKGALPEEASIHTAKMTIIKVALKEIYKREEKGWVICTDFQSSMQTIEYNKENHSNLQIKNIKRSHCVKCLQTYELNESKYG